MATSPRIERIGTRAVFAEVRVGATKARPQGYPLWRPDELLLAGWDTVSGQSSFGYTLTDYAEATNYKDLLLCIRSWQSGTDDRLGFVTVNGLSANYQQSYHVHRYSSVHGQSDYTGGSEFRFGGTGSTEAIGADSGEVMHADIRFADWQDASTGYIAMVGHMWGIIAAGSRGWDQWVSGYISTTAAIASFLVAMESGATLSFDAALYGDKRIA